MKEIAGSFGLRGDILPVRSVGVQGDARTYAHPAVLIGATDWDTLESASTAITNAVPEVNRAVWLCRPATLPELHLREGYLVQERLDLLRCADDISMKVLLEDGLMDTVFQFPTILTPLTAGKGETIVLRPLESKDVMTARFARLQRRR